MPGMTNSVYDFTRHIVESCGLDSASIFLCDRVSSKPRVSYLFHYQISDVVQDRYERHTVFHEDPFTDPRIKEQPDLMHDDGLLLAADRRVQSGDFARGRYWPFMRDHGIDVIGASTRRLLPGVYATIGFHRRRDGSHGAAVPVKRLDTLARRLQDMTSGLMLRQILDQANGLSTFRSSYFERTQAASAHPRKALSLREREIASLVCEGRLNKEIAYIVGLSEHTVENHLRRIYAKFSIHNRSALVAAMAAI